jgi:hypothetical protein
MHSATIFELLNERNKVMLSQVLPSIRSTGEAHGVKMPVASLLYEGVYRRTAQVDYGATLEALVSGEAPIPPSGARVDIHFEGKLQGPRLNGYLTGVDYLLVRADGRCDLNMHARIDTEDGARIAFWSDGIFVPPTGGSGIAQIRENVRLTTADPRYQWVNTLQVWLTGYIELAQETIYATAYIA